MRFRTATSTSHQVTSQLAPSRHDASRQTASRHVASRPAKSGRQDGHNGNRANKDHVPAGRRCERATLVEPCWYVRSSSVPPPEISSKLSRAQHHGPCSAGKTGVPFPGTAECAERLNNCFVKLFHLRNTSTDMLERHDGNDMMERHASEYPRGLMETSRWNDMME